MASRKVVLFAGPSVCGLERRLDNVDVRGPARRGDLLGASGGELVVLLDGFFGADLAVTPRECMDLMETGAYLVGACSIGALRAAELNHNGMIGIGQVYLYFRTTPLARDADIATAYVPGGTEEATLSQYQVRYVLQYAVSERLITDEEALKMLGESEGVYWAMRTWAKLNDVWSGRVSERAIRAFEGLYIDDRHHPKRSDAESVVEWLEQSRFGESWLSSVDSQGAL